MFPLIDESHFVGALWDPVEGHLDPSGTTHAYAKSAKILGAELSLRNRVVELNQNSDGIWNVVTEKGTIKTEHVVNAGGLWAHKPPALTTCSVLIVPFSVTTFHIPSEF